MSIFDFFKKIFNPKESIKEEQINTTNVVQKKEEIIETTTIDTTTTIINTKITKIKEGKNNRMYYLDELIKKYCERLSDISFNYDKEILLKTIATKESSYGKNNKPRFEKAYYIGGSLYKNFNNTYRSLIEEYKKDAACSWSSFQIMFMNAYDMGYKGKPSDLSNDEIAIPFVIDYINKRILKRNPKKLEDIFDAYNSGSFSDRVVPQSYISGSMNVYKTLLNKKG